MPQISLQHIGITEEIANDVKFSIVEAPLPSKSCFFKADSLAKCFVTTPEITAKLKNFMGKKVAVLTVE